MAIIVRLTRILNRFITELVKKHSAELSARLQLVALLVASGVMWRKYLIAIWRKDHNAGGST